jgi:hypothetical protein
MPRAIFHRVFFEEVVLEGSGLDAPLNSTGLVANAHRHVGGIRTRVIVTEWLARRESRAHVERASWRKCFHDPSLQAHTFKAALAGDSEEMVKHRSTDAQATDMLGCVHRLQLRVPIVKPLERADRDQLPAAADTEEGDGGIEQTIDLEGVRILWRAVQTPELQMMLDELSHVIDPWISDDDVKLIHQRATSPVRRARKYGA